MGQNIYDLTNPQKSIWYTEQFFKGSTLNNICGSMFIDEIVDFDLLKKAINQFVKDNDGFRFELFYDENGEIKQKVVDFEPFDIELVDLKSKDEISNLENDMTNEPFSLIENKLYRLKMYRLPDNKGGFLLIAHHLIYDAYTASLVTSKVVNIYSAFKKGEESPEKPTSYINYINNENEYLQSDKFEKDKEYWNSVFETIPEIGTIPSIHETTENSCKALRRTFTISKEKMQELNEFCSNNKISIFNLFMGLYAIYIGKVSNLDDFVIGTPILNRSNFEEKNTPGTFISTVPFRFVLDDSKSFIDFEKEIASGAFSMFRHQKYPYQNILDDIRKKNPSQPNLYDILISYQNARNNRNSSDIPYRTRWTFNDNVADSMQIHLFDINDDGALSISYDYRTNKYDEIDIENIHNRILYIIEQILFKQDLSLGDISIVTPKERDVILNKFNDTYLEYDKTKTVVDYFEEQVEKTPENIAIVYNNQTLTYKQLNAKVNSLAHYLRDKGIKNNDIVGIMVNRSFEMIIGILAVLKSGGAYIPIDPEYPEDRVIYVLNNSNCSILLSQAILNDKLKKLNFEKETVLVDLSNKDIYTNNSNNLVKINNPDDLSYIIYTSGSTGLPKGVMLTHKNLSNFYNSMVNKIDYLKDGIYHSIASITTVSFDIFAFETIISLTRGLRLFITNNDEQKMTLKIEKLLLDYKIEIIQTTPSIMNFHLENSSLNGFSGLKYIMLAGEQLPKQLVDKIHSVTNNCKIYNGYGPSETTIFSTVKDVTNLDTITIGTPIDNTQIYILNDHLRLLPQGTLGEIYIAGDGVGRGYLNNKDLTTERYLSDPFRKNSIMYKTGDYGIWLNNGDILCKGRIDNQIKLRGLRIELGEIESCINSYIEYADIQSAIILKDEEGKASLNAFISSKSEINVDDLRNYLSSKLPTYMIPNTFTFIDNLPFTPNGKIDRKALQYYKVDSEYNCESFVQPRNEIEKTILDSVKKKLGLSDLGIDNNIFDYGADSLSIINILTDLFRYNINLKVYDFYQHPTIRSLYDSLLADNEIENHTIDDSFYHLNSLVKNFSTSTDAQAINDKKTIFLTGVTGFFGVHILADLLEQKDKINKIYCSIRKKGNLSIEERLTHQLHFYFGNAYDSIIKDLVVCVESNINDYMLNINSETLSELKDSVDCVIHCAANVKHYGNYSDFENTNINGTKNIIAFCKFINSPLHYISTMTISGNYLLEQNNHVLFNENSFYENQSFDNNVYSKSKLIAESLVLKAIENGLNATIYRIGDLTGRYSDGMFQKNIEDNSIYLRLKSILEIGNIPNTILENNLEFTPVEYAAKSICKIIWSNKKENRIFHIYNPNMIKVNTLINYLHQFNININISSLDEFLEKVKNLSSFEETQSQIVGIINDFTNENDLIYNHIIETENDITCKYLKNLGFDWPILDANYFKKLINYMISVNFLKMEV